MNALLAEKRVDQETRAVYDEARYNNVVDSTKEQIIAMMKCAVSGSNSTAFSYLEEYEYEIKGSYTKSNCVKFQGKKIIVVLGRFSSLNGSHGYIQDFFFEDTDKLKNGVNAENVYPYALEMLFEGKSPNSKLKIVDHFQDGNLAYVSTTVRKDLKKYNKHGYDYVEHKREMVIEKWGKNSENIKIKSKKFVEDFKVLMEQKRAPKAKVIEVVLKKQAGRSSNIEIREKANKESYLELATGFDFTGTYFLSTVEHVWVKYTNGTVVWVGTRQDTYDPITGKVSSYNKPDRFFKLNEFNGIVEVQENPIIFIELVKEEPAPEVVAYLNKEDFYLKTNEDETEIINTFEDHAYMSAAIVKETPHAREYEVKNIINGKSFSAFFVKYDDVWIHSNIGNRKVQQMLEVYALAEQISDEDEAV